MPLFQFLYRVYLKDLLRGLARQRWRPAILLKTLLILLLLTAASASGYVLPFGLWAIKEASPALIVNEYLGILLPTSFAGKVMLANLPDSTVLSYRNLPLPADHLVNLILIRSAGNGIFLAESVFFCSFYLACAGRFPVSGAWLLTLILTLTLVNLYALLTKIAFYQWAGLYPHERRINTTVMLGVVLLTGILALKEATTAFYDGLLAGISPSLSFFLFFFFLLLWWWKKLLRPVIRYA